MEQKMRNERARTTSVKYLNVVLGLARLNVLSALAAACQHGGIERIGWLLVPRQPTFALSRQRKMRGTIDLR